MENLAFFSQMISGFPGAHTVLTRTLPVKLTLNQVWQQALRVGSDLVRRRDDEVKAMLEGRPPQPPANAPDLVVISPDGGRIQDRSRPAGDRWCEYPTGPLHQPFGPAGKAAVVYRVAREESAREGLRPDPQLAPHWRYRAGTDGFERVEAGKKLYSDPEPETKTFTASTETVERFPLMVELEAKRRGMLQAHTVCFVGDGGDFVWRTAREVCADRRARGGRVFEILDIIHAGEHVSDAANAAFGATTEGASWLNARLAELWRGDAEELIRALEAEALDLGPRPGAEKSAARVVWNARDYFCEHRERIRYDAFRRHGLPLTSCHVESGIPVRQDRPDRRADRTSGKQTNNRVHEGQVRRRGSYRTWKGSEKQWLLGNAEAMLALRCLALSEDGRWDGYFEGLRRGEVALPTPGRAARRPAAVLPLTRDLRKTG